MMATPRKLGLLATLYLSQGLPFGFFTQALPVLLRRRGVSLVGIGLTSMLAAPWALKFLWAPVVDRYGSERFGRRRSWIVPLQLCAVGLLLAVAPLDPTTALPWLLVAVFATNLVAATQDIATDGMAVEMLHRSERGLGNGVQVAGYRVGMIIGGGGLMVLFHHLDWEATFLLAAGAMALATVPIVLHREPVRGPAPLPPDRAATGAVRDVLRQPGMKRWLAVLVTYKAGDALATGMLRPFLVDIGLDLGDIGWLLGAGGFSAGLLGALAGGWAINQLGRHRALIGFGSLQAASVCAYLLPALGHASPPVLYAVCALEHLSGGMATAALFTLMMDRCRTTSAATDYTVQACGVVIATGVASAVSGVSAGWLGYSGHFALAGLVCVIGLVYARRVLAEQPTPRRGQRRSNWTSSGSRAESAPR